MSGTDQPGFRYARLIGAQEIGQAVQHARIGTASRIVRRSKSELRRLMRRPNLMTTIGFLVAAPTLATLGLYSWLFLRSMLRDPTLKHLITLLFLWQTQIGAAFAIAAALLGAAVILHQTATARRLEEKRRERRVAALRAVLPLALMQLSDYAASGAKIHAALLGQPKTQRIKASGLQFPSLPDELVSRLTELIEATDSDRARPLIILVRRLQIHHARARDTQMRSTAQQGSILVRTNVVGRVIDAAEIYARCEKLFVYARSDADVPVAAVSPDDVKNALLLISASLTDMEELEQGIKRRESEDQNGPSWPES